MQLIISPVLYTEDIINCTSVFWTEASFFGSQVLRLTVWGSKLCDYTPNSLGKLPPLYVWLCETVEEERETDRLLAFIHVEQEFLTCYYSRSLFFSTSWLLSGWLLLGNMELIWWMCVWRVECEWPVYTGTVKDLHWVSRQRALYNITPLSTTAFDIKLCVSYFICFFCRWLLIYLCSHLLGQWWCHIPLQCNTWGDKSKERPE